MRIRVNGKPREVEPGTTAALLLAALEFDTRYAAVAVNAAVVPRSLLPGRVLAEGDEVEIIEIVGGG